MTYTGKAPLNEDTENAFLRIVIAWESFLSEWLISAVVRDPTTLGAKFQRELEEWTARKYGLTVREHQAATGLTALKTSLHFSSPSYSEVRQLLDPRGYNIEFKSLDDFCNQAQELTAQYAARTHGLVPRRGHANHGIVEAATSIRNWLAHHSPFSHAVMQSRLAALANAELAQASFPTSAGGYLKHHLSGAAVGLPQFTAAAQPSGSQAPIDPYERRRFLLYCAEYVRVAWRLVPIDDT